MGLFTSREHAGRFIADDPFVVEGLAVPRILEWDVVRFDYADPASLPIGEGRQHR
ncbi:YciI family protein [Arthrobacter sp. Z4-13]